MKEKISNKLKREFEAYLNGLVSADYFRNGIDEALDEYADWKIRECLPERRNPNDWNKHIEIISFDNGWNACIDYMLNKDKK